MRGKQVPINVWNLGSSQGGKLNFAQQTLWSRMRIEIAKTAAKIPVYLVNEQQMDYLYPPELRKALDPECLIRIFDESPDIEENPDKLDMLEDICNSWDKYCVVVAVGLYLKLRGYGQSERQKVIDLGDNGICDPVARDSFLSEHNPSVFLCPERVINWAGRAGIPSDLVLAKVYYHELGHAFMDTLKKGPNPYSKLWGRVIEESLANLIAVKQFKGKEAILIHRLIKDQPAEYRGYAVLENNLLFPFDPKLLKFMSLREFHYYLEDVIEHFSWLIRRIPPPLLNLIHPLLILPDTAGNKNIQLWRELKRNGAFRDSKIVNALEKAVIFILRESVL